MADQQPPRPERDAPNQQRSDVPESSSGEGLPDWIAQLREPESSAPADPRHSAGPAPAAAPGQNDGTGRHARPPHPGQAPIRPGDQPGPEARGGWQPAPLAGGWEPTAGGWEQPRPAAPPVQRPEPNHHQQQPDQRQRPDPRQPDPRQRRYQQPQQHQPGPPPPAQQPPGGEQHQRPGGWEQPGGWAQPAPGQHYPIPPSAPPEDPRPPRGQVPPPQHSARPPAPQPNQVQYPPQYSPQYPPQYPAPAGHQPPPFTPAPPLHQPGHEPPPAPAEQAPPAGASGWPPPEPPPWTEPEPAAEWAPPAEPAEERPAEDALATGEQVDEGQPEGTAEPEPAHGPDASAAEESHEPEAATDQAPDQATDQATDQAPDQAPDIEPVVDSEPAVDSPQGVDNPVDIAESAPVEDPHQGAEPLDVAPATEEDHNLPDQPVEYPLSAAQPRPAGYPQEPHDGDEQPGQYSRAQYPTPDQPEPSSAEPQEPAQPQYSRSQYSQEQEPQRPQYVRQPQGEPVADDAGWGPAPEADQGWDNPAADDAAQVEPAQVEPAQVEAAQDAAAQDAPAQDAPAQDAPAQDAPAQDAPAPENAAEDDWDQSVAEGWDDPVLEPAAARSAPESTAPAEDEAPQRPIDPSWEQPGQPDYGWDEPAPQDQTNEQAQERAQEQGWEQGWEQPQQAPPRYDQAPAPQYSQETQYAPPAEPAQPRYAAPSGYPAQSQDAAQYPPQEQYSQPEQYAQPVQPAQQYQYPQQSSYGRTDQYPPAEQYQQPAQQQPPNHYQPEQPNHPVGYTIPSTGYQPGGGQAPHQEAGRLSTADDLTSTNLLKQRGEVPTHGWRKAVFKVSAGTVNLGPSRAEQEQATTFSRIRTTIRGCHRIAVVSLKGGIGKTTTTSCLGLTLAHYRGDRVVALDANPDAGTLAERLTGNVDLTVRDLLDHIERIQTFTEVSAYTTLAGRLQVLASDQDPEVSQAFGDKEYRQVCSLLARFYNVVLTDSGTGLLHSAMAGTLAMADSLVVVSAPSVDGASRAAKTLDWLIAHGYGELVSRSVAVISSVRPMTGEVDMNVLRNHFGARCRQVIDIPYDPHLVTGGLIEIGQLKPATKNAYLELAATVADDFASTRPGRY